MTGKSYDVVVVGAGNAGLAAAVSAKESGAGSVLVLEKAPREMRGGDTCWAGGGLRFAFENADELLAIFPEGRDHVASLGDAFRPFTREAFTRDIAHVANGRVDQELLDLLATRSRDTIGWMRSVGRIGLQLRLPSAGQLKGNAMDGGSVVQSPDGGHGLSRDWFAAAERMGAEIRYGTGATELLLADDGRVAGVVARGESGLERIGARSVVLAAGGFGANLQMRAQHLGPLLAAARVRGTPYNQGDGLRMALAIGAMPWGQWDGCHATPVSADWGDYTPRDVAYRSRRASYMYSVMINRRGRRFVDEGEDKALMTYSKVTRAILGQPGAVAWQIFDNKVSELLDGYYKSSATIEADTLEALIGRLDIDDRPQALKTIAEFNSHANDPADRFDPMRKDGVTTAGLTPEKSNWALKLDQPPYRAYSVAGGITWTYGGLKISRDAQVIGTDWRPIPGLFCCGEMVGGLFYYNYPDGTGYPAGAGFISGATFGRIAGHHAAKGHL